MLDEALEAPAAIARQLGNDEAASASFGAHLREQVPSAAAPTTRRTSWRT
jgi:hypothetical protein